MRFSGILGSLRPNPPLTLLNQLFPLNVWSDCLKGYPHYQYIMSGLKNGFSIGVDDRKAGNPDLISGESRFIPLNSVQKTAISEWILKGVKRGYI